MPEYTIYNDNPAKSTAKILDRIDKPTPQAAGAEYWNKHRDAWQQRVVDFAGDPVEHAYSLRKLTQWNADRAVRSLWIGTGGSFQEYGPGTTIGESPR